jgi:AcrR family transcriptional regulator
MPRNSAADAAATRKRIMESARSLFAEKGFAETSTREISAAAGVTVGAMFHHFDSKLALFRCVFEALELEMDAAARAAFATHAIADPLEAMLVGTRVSLEFAKRQDFRRIVLIDGPVVLGQGEFHEVDAHLGLRTVAGAVKAMKLAGIIADQPTRPLAVLLMGAMNNAGFAVARDEPGVDADSLIEALRMLLVGLKSRGEDLAAD